LAADIRGGYEQLSSEKLGFYVDAEGLWGHAWRFDVAKNFSQAAGGDEVRLKLLGVDKLQEGTIAYLIDRKLGRQIVLREQNGYVFFLGRKGFVASESDARFVLLVGSEEYVEHEAEHLTTRPQKTALLQNYPNPFNPSTVISYDLASREKVDLRIYDVTGALVKILERGTRDPGRFEVGWDGQDEKGRKLASGVYFYQLKAGRFSQTRKMVLLK
jgi:hypothetical protein